MAITIAILTGYWSTNIGNSFFQLGAEYILKKIFPNANIFFVGDEQGYIRPSKGNPINSYNPIYSSKIDYLVLLGPFIRKDFFQITAPSIDYFYKKGTKIIALGVGMMEYDPNIFKKVGEFLKKYPPVLLATRDTETYEALKDYVPVIYDGIDLGFFTSELWQNSPPYIDLPYITFNFDQIPEPKFLKTTVNNTTNTFPIGDLNYQIKFNNFRRRWCENGFIFQLADQLFIPQPKIDYLGNHKIIRTDHR